MEYIDKVILRQIYIESVKTKIESFAKLRKYYATIGTQTQENNRDIDGVEAVVCVIEKMISRPPDLK